MVLFALALSLLRVGMPWVNDYRGLIASQLAHVIKHPVEIGRIEAGWSGHRPSLGIQDVSVSEAETLQPLMEFDRIYIELDPWRSLIQWQPVAHRIILTGSRIAVTRGSNGQILFKGFEYLDKTQGASLEQIAGLSLSLRDIQVSWWDEPLQQQFDFTAENLDFQAADHSLAIDARIDLPESLGEQIHLIALARGPLGSFHDWRLRFFLQGRSIDVPGLPLKWPREAPLASSGELDLRLWGEWDRKAGGEVSGMLDLYGLRFDGPPQNGDVGRFEFIDELSTNLRMTGAVDDWQIHLDQLVMVTPDRHWPESGLSLAYENLDGEAAYRGHVGFIDLSDIANLVSLSPALPDDQLQQLRRHQPDGDLSAFAFELRTAGQAPEYRFEGQLNNAQWISDDTVPGFFGVSGDFSLDELGGELLLDSENAMFVYPKLFYWPLEFRQMQAQLEWHRENDAWTLSLDKLRLENEDAMVLGGGHLLLGEGEQYPSLNLELLLPRAALQKARRYIPYYTIKSAPARRWLQRAFGGGEARNGRFSYQGPLRGKAFKDGSAKMLATFDVDNADLHYQKGWPSLHKLKGKIRFENASLRTRIDSGRIFGASIRPGGRVDINSFYRSRLDIDASARTTLTDVLRYVRESPLGTGMEDFLAKVDSAGGTELDLKMRIPLTKKLREPIQVDGVLDMPAAKLALPEHDVDFSQIKGRLAFTKDTYSAQGIEALFRGSPVSADIETWEDGQVEVAVTGDFSATDLLPAAHATLEPLLQGQSAWSGRLGIPSRDARAAGESIWLDVSSKLEGIKVDLPAPLGKEHSWPRQFKMRYHFNADFPRVDASYGNSLQLAAELEKGAGFDFHRAVIGLSLGDYKLPQNGIELRGSWPFLRTAAWSKVVRRIPASAAVESSGILADLDTIGVTFATLDIGGRKFKDMQIQSGKNEIDWRIHLDSPALAGDITMPHAWRKGVPLQARLNRLHLPPATVDKETTPLSPSSLPAVKVEIDDFRRGDGRLGKLLLNTTRNPAGQTIDLLRLEADSFVMNASGTWLEGDKTQRTGLDIELTSKDLGSTLVALGYGDNLVHGSGEAKGDLTWFGPAYQPDIPGLKGSLKFTFKNGMLRKVDPGLGRLLSLLSVDYLPRRFKLNFKDVAEEGFYYDTLTGSAEIESGMLYTPGLLIDGPSAALALSGRTGLADHNYNMQLELVPKFKSTVPIAAGVLAGPQTGLLVYLFDKLMEGAGLDFNRSVTLDYDITGTWEEPLITSLQSHTEDATEPGREEDAF